ncbi:AEC family transporter [Clostridium sp. PL3]|uniref:AEC family transporter n=1 Tax=Clostridium thailandense TaxID=2794346 RepID=A0A949X4R1_9CLOT|nr:AEC family transporter [Clostridium thailandense]MBV7274398.1 AEC family transporter [Clostridium thailandense]
MAVVNALGSVLSIVIMITVGYVLTSKGWFDEKTSKVFSRLVCNVSLPCLMISDLMGNFDKDKLNSLGKGLIIPFTSIALCYLIAIIVSKIIKVDKNRIGTFRSMFFVSNSIFIGLPVNLALFGSKSIPYVLLYYIANTSFFWTIGAYGISADGQSKKSSIFSKETFKRIVSPPLMGFVVALVFITLNVKLPQFIMDTCKYFGNLTTPVSMLFIGITIYSVDTSEIKINIDMVAILFGRFIISPILIFVMAHYFPVPELMKKVFVVQAAMPVMTNTAIVARSYGADHKYATIMTVVTTISSLVFIPIYMALLG